MLGKNLYPLEDLQSDLQPPAGRVEPVSRLSILRGGLRRPPVRGSLSLILLEGSAAQGACGEMAPSRGANGYGANGSN